MPRVPFRARARTVDHLGREQIADCPTAVSELWKNAYDAYARKVGLHIFDGAIPVAAVVDDGHGMSRDEFIERWLMLGTEAKAGEEEVPAEDRDGLPLRPRQGQKGIGRLSVAYLGPTVLVLTKRRGGPIVAALLDWRLFENPYLALDDVQVPVEELADPIGVHAIFERLLEGLVDNLWENAEEPNAEEPNAEEPNAEEPKRRMRLKSAWQRFSEDEQARGQESTANRIAALALAGSLEERHLATWPVWTGERDRGTALFVFDVVRELRVWVDPALPDEDPEIQEIREKLRFTLTGFVDPYSAELPEFQYEVTPHQGDKQMRAIVSSGEVVGIHDLRELEHVVEGRFDEAGQFTGQVRAWGKDFGTVTVSPASPPPPRGRGFVGAFEISFGTFEQEPKNSTHPADVVGLLKERADRYSGLAVYRDGLRVQPYGRPEADFFGMEERRGKSAGREFWAHRRTFGRVAITRAENSQLRDKAGREGLIDNQAARVFRLLVVELLRTLARRYFGSDADLRDRETSETKDRFQRAKDAEKRARAKRVTSLKEALKANREDLAAAISEARKLNELLGGEASVEESAERLERLRTERAALALPPRPHKMTAALEERYRAYRDDFAELTSLLEVADARWTALADSSSHAPFDVARSALGRHQKFLTDATGRWMRSIRERLDDERTRWEKRVAEDNSLYYREAAPWLQDVADGRLALRVALSEMEALREKQFSILSDVYEGYLRALENLAEEIDLEGALAWSTDERAELASKVEQWQTLAQLGITVEIIGHELSESAAQVSRNLSRLPAGARQTEAYKLAYGGFRSLVQRLDFLAPLRLSGPRLRETILGTTIERYLREFFARQITDRRVEFVVTPAFLEMSLVEYSHRVFPVFVNLVNNALYWVSFVEDRRILLDRVGSKVYVADSGAGVDPDDVPNLFQLFFTRKVGGHGVGLYLSRISLEQGRHRIRYADPDEHLLPGANFILDFQDFQNE